MRGFVWLADDVLRPNRQESGQERECLRFLLEYDDLCPDIIGTVSEPNIHNLEPLPAQLIGCNARHVGTPIAIAHLDAGRLVGHLVIDSISMV